MPRNRNRKTRRVADVRNELIRSELAGKISRSGSATFPDSKFRYVKESPVTQPPPPVLPDVRDIPALLLACLAGDEDGARVIIEASDQVAMVFAVCAFTNQMRGRADFETPEDYAGYLRAVAAAMAADLG
jgi:hypothetical protein